MNEIGGTFEWSEEQIKAYAAAFREGDAVKVDGEGWVEVKTHNAVWGEYLAVGDPDGAMLNAAGKGSCGAFLQGGGSCVVVTPKDYEVQEGDKLVRLGKTVEQYGQSELTFGKVYEVVRWHEDGELVYKNDMTTALLASYLKDEVGMWGVIPRYENVKEKNNMDNKNEHFGKAETFKVGDRVRVNGTDSRFEGCIGKVDNTHETGDVTHYLATFDDGDFCWFDASDLELVSEEKSPEQEAFEYLLSQDRDATRSILQGEISIWANVHLEHRDYDDLRQVIEILEKLEKGE